ncbi:MAG: TetR/AcrR family transcriptional regulator [Candidatus Gastranaerophilaceae bacterium]
MNSEKKKQNLSRKKIINSAIVLFARKGFESTSTREICKHAGVNLSLIPYYFGNKDGLYTDIIESIINYGLTFLHEDILKTNYLSDMTQEEKVDLYRLLLMKYLNFLYSENVPSSFVILMVKEQVVTHSKFSEIYSQKIGVYYKALRKTLASILNKKETDKSIIFQISSIIGQLLSFKFMDRATLSAFNQDFYTKDDLTKIKKIASDYVDKELEKLKIKTPTLT